MHDVIKGSLEVLQQGNNFLNSVSDDAYTKIVKPIFISSSGEHMRHIIDHFLVIKDGHEKGVINYDKRNRGCQVENHRSQALLKMHEIKQWMIALDDDVLSQPLIIKTEVALSESVVVEVASTLERELVFAASHAVHHYSSIANAIQMQDLTLDKKFGIAPATATFLRSNDDNKCAQSAG